MLGGVGPFTGVGYDSVEVFVRGGWQVGSDPLAPRLYAKNTMALVTRNCV